MSKYCSQCGNELNNDMVVCPKCGTKQPKIKEAGLKMQKKNMIIVGVIAVVLLLFVFGVPKKIGEKRDIAQCTKVVETFDKAIRTGDLKSLKKVYLPAFYEEIASDFSSEAKMAEAFAEEAADLNESVQLQSLWEVDIDTKYEELDNYMEEKDIKKVKQIFMASVKVSEGEGYLGYSYTTDVPIVRIGSKWYWGDMYF